MIPQMEQVEPRTQRRVHEGMNILLGWVVRTARCERGCVVVTPQLTSAASWRTESKKCDTNQNNAISIYMCQFCSHDFEVFIIHKYVSILTY